MMAKSAQWLSRALALVLLVATALSFSFKPLSLCPSQKIGTRGLPKSIRSSNGFESKAASLIGHCMATKDDGSEQEPEKKKPKMSLGALVQLMTMGAGAPSLGEFDRMDPETGKMFFKLEANNFADSEGNSMQTKAKYFTDGYVEEDAELSPPNFFANLMSGGKLQAEWEQKIKERGDSRK